MNKIGYIVFIIFLAIFIGSTGNFVKDRIALDIPQSAVFNNNFPQERPRYKRQSERNKNHKRWEYNDNSSAKYNRRQNKMYNSGADRSYYEHYHRQSRQY